MRESIRKKIARLQARGLLELAREDNFPAGNPLEGRGQTYHFSLHNPIWAYCHPVFKFPYDPQSHNKPLFEIYDRSQSYEEIRDTEYLVFVGTDCNDDFQKIIRLPRPLKLFFEPDIAHFFNFLAKLDIEEVIDQNVFFVVGDLKKMPRSLAEILGPDINQLGFPVFWLQEGLEKNYPDYLAALMEHLEFLYYRHRIYPVEGQENQKGLPLRNLKRDLFFDQQKHFYENIYEYTVSGNLEQLRGLLPGRTAILIGAGPDLDRRLDYLRRNQDKAVLICVNNALKTLLHHGLEPHFVVINDTSLGPEQSLADLPPLPDTLLVAHCLSWHGGPSFGGKFFYGNWAPEIFGSRPQLPMHGSVITAAFSLAEFLGCSTAVLVGVQLASASPWRFSYSQHCIHGGAQGEPELELIHRYPQFYPVQAASGAQLFTTLNMREASFWFLDHIKKSNIKVINACCDSILYGDNISINENYQVNGNSDIKQIIKKIKSLLFNNQEENAIDFIVREIDYWNNIKNDCFRLAENLIIIKTFQEYINFYDNNNCTYLLQRFNGFDYNNFSELFYCSADNSKIREGAVYYFKNLTEMAEYFEELLLSQLQKFSGKG